MKSKPDLSPELIEEFVLSAHGNYPRVRAMLEHEPRLLNMKWLRYDENALEASGHMGRADILGLLLEKGAPLTIFAAAVLGQTADVQAFLLAEPALASSRGVHGISLLYHAALSGKVEIAEMLAERDAAQDVSNALHAAVRMGHAEMAAWLLARGADPNTPNFEGKTTLDVALRDKSREDLAELIRRYGGLEGVEAHEVGA